MDPRPLSPHLQIYRWPLTAVMSIMHRMSGIALLGVVIELITCLFCLSHGPETYTQFLHWLHWWGAQFLNAIAVFCLTYHFLNGIRYLFWDIGWGLDISQAYKSSCFILILTVLIGATIIWAWCGL